MQGRREEAQADAENEAHGQIARAGWCPDPAAGPRVPKGSGVLHGDVLTGPCREITPRNPLAVEKMLCACPLTAVGRIIPN